MNNPTPTELAEALVRLRLGVEMDAWHDPDGATKLAALDAAIAALRTARQAELVAYPVGPYRVTVAENAITISEGRKLVFSYDADQPATSASASEPAYDRELISDMLNEYAEFPGQVRKYLKATIATQIAALRQADNRDAAGVRTASSSDAELPGMWERSDFMGGATDCEAVTPASASEAVPVAWAMTDYQADGPMTMCTSSRESAEYWESQGLQVEPLYAHPAPASGEGQQGDAHADDLAVDRFAAAMKEKLAAARAKGRGGWEDREDCSQERLSDMLRTHVEKGDPRDVANFACFLWNRGESIAATQQQAGQAVYQQRDDFGLWRDTDKANHDWWRDHSSTPDEVRTLYTAPQEPDGMVMVSAEVVQYAVAHFDDDAEPEDKWAAAEFRKAIAASKARGGESAA